MPRDMLEKEKLLQYILKPNAAIRKDAKWISHVNLSINDINRRFFSASERWHPNLWWVILSFDPEILEHSGVHFGTTNNIYPGVLIKSGVEGLEQLYKEPISHGYPRWPEHTRLHTSEEDPTCPQAEVLYPGPLSLRFLKRVYVRDAAIYLEACSFLTFLPNAESIEVKIDPDRFTRSKVDACNP